MATASPESLLSDDAHWLARFSSATADRAVALLAFALFRAWQVTRTQDFVAQTGCHPSQFNAAEFLRLARPEILDRIVSDAQAMLGRRISERDNAPRGRAETGMAGRDANVASGQVVSGRYVFIAAFTGAFASVLLCIVLLSVLNLHGLNIAVAPERSLSADLAFAIPPVLGGFGLGYIVRAYVSKQRRSRYYV